MLLFWICRLMHNLCRGVRIVNVEMEGWGVGERGGGGGGGGEGLEMRRRIMNAVDVMKVVGCVSSGPSVGLRRLRLYLL